MYQLTEKPGDTLCTGQLGEHCKCSVCAESKSYVVWPHISFLLKGT